MKKIQFFPSFWVILKINQISFEPNPIQMQNRTLGTLHIYLDDGDPNMKATFELAEGENFIGSSLFCDVKLAYANIDDLHCKITLTPQGDSSIEDLSKAAFGIYRSTPKSARQKLRSNKEYELLPDRPFYFANKYRCVYRPKGQAGSFNT